MKVREIISVILAVVNLITLAYCLVNTNKSEKKLKKIQSKLNAIKEDLSDVTSDLEDLTDELNETTKKKDKKKKSKVEDIAIVEDINADDIAEIDAVDDIPTETEEEVEE
jgi:peptidoglycan hydrolase CwlO-like protein